MNERTILFVIGLFAPVRIEAQNERERLILRLRGDGSGYEVESAERFTDAAQQIEML